MRSVAFALAVALLVAGAAGADPTWSQISFSVPPSNAPKVVAAADTLMGSAVGKKFPGKLLLQANVVDGSNPATHTFVPVYRSTADREAFVQELQASDAWSAFQSSMENNTEPVSTVLYRTVKSWGDINETDGVWMAHAFDVSDPAAFTKAVEDFLASETGKKFPGQVYLSAVVAAGMSPVSHVISVGYASEAEMDTWTQTRDASADWANYQQASQPAAEYLGGSIARTVKTWGPATFQEIVAP